MQTLVVVLVLTTVMIMMISRRSFALINKKVLRRLPSFSSLSSSLSSSTTSSSPVLDDSIIEKDGPIQADAVNVNSPFLKTLFERGYIHQCTDLDGLDKKFSTETVIAYLGFDATASSLHVGSLLQIMILRNLQKAGHKPVILIGGGTTKVGDPSGKDESRQLLTEETIASNANSISQIFKKYITFEGTTTTTSVTTPNINIIEGDSSVKKASDAIMVNNADWLNNINYLEFLRDYGRYFTINRMLNFESVKQRLAREQPLTFLEFNYMLLQAYDFLELSRRYNACLQLGGSDQWGNIVSGIELGRKIDQRQLYGLTAPLMTTADGKKMGKTAAGAVWLNKDLLPPFEYWQFWRNIADADTIKFLKLFTDMPMDEINEMEKWEGSQLNAAKIRLADETTSMLHGKDCLAEIHKTIETLFSKGGSGNLDSLEKISLDSETSSLIKEGIPVVDILIKANMAKSKGEARRFIQGGGAKVNDEKVSDENAVVKEADFNADGQLKLSSGKKKHVLIVLSK